MLDILKTFCSAVAAGATGVRIVRPVKGPRNAQVSDCAAKSAGPAPAPQAAITIPSHQLRGASQWERVTGIIATATVAARNAATVQEAARVQLEVAEFSIDRIRDEIADIMALPAIASAPQAMMLIEPAHKIAA